MQALLDLRSEIPSNKFYPPRLDIGTSLFRSHLITEKLGETSLNSTAVVIEAQAGQGKSMLAAQFLDHFDLRSAWYQVGPEDGDPVLLLSALIANFRRRLPSFDSPQLAHIMNRGEIGPLDLKRCVNILLSDLDKFLADDFYLVLDDLHLIENASLATSLLDHLIDTAPPRLHFLLTSRRPLTLTSRTLRYGSNTCYLDNDDLCLSAAEVEHLLNRTLKINISHNEAEALRNATGGWIMGILLATHPGSAGKKKGAFLPDRLSVPELMDYFRAEIFSQIPEKLQLPLLQISFLKEIPVDLAEKITGSRKIGAWLNKMMQDNYFVYPLDDEQQAFRFHHLFQEFLQYRAREIMKADEISRLNQVAAEYYLEKGFVEKALACYADQKNYSAMETLLQREGLDLLARNRTITLLTLLTTIPQERLVEHGWLPLFCGLVYSDFQPGESLPLLEAALQKFTTEGEETGELLTLSQIIYFHFVVSGLYNTGSRLLPRTEELLLRNLDDLPFNARIIVARNLAAGYCFFNSDMDQARRYAHMARDLAIRHNIHNGMAAARFICGYAESLTGNQGECLQEIELSYPLLHDPLVSMSNKLTLRVLHLNFLSKFGDIINFDHQQQLLRATIDTNIVKQTVAAPYLYVWGCSCLVSVGRLDRAGEMLLQGTATADSAGIPHMRSQLLQWQGYILALQGDGDAAVRAVQEAGTLRNLAGGPFYETFYEIMAGAIYSRTGMEKEAETMLASAIAKAGKIPSEYLTAAALFHRSRLRLQQNNMSAGEEDLRKALTIMRTNNYSFFWSWEPGFTLELLSFAVLRKIEPRFVEQLARQRLAVFFSKKGKPLPLLNISLLGPFQISTGSGNVLTVEDFTPAQRTLLSLLLTNPEQKMDQETIQVALWPDSAPDKARAKFDTLLTRLRKVLTSRLAVPIKHYLVMRKGILSLKNCRIDGVEFETLAISGLKHSHAERYWQAGNAFYRALSLWTGPLETDSFMAGQTMKYYGQMISLLTKITNTWAANLVESDCTTEAVDILVKTLRYDQMNDRLITLLYGLYLHSGNPLKAKETIINYRQVLRDMDYDQEQIDELLFQVASKAV
jgi:ATP/maltotriose-dependent transcriptional regulator MalT/DNA-binding SARP family transcriptional activator